MAWALAIAATESEFQPDRVNMSRGDKRRGGSYGLCQMSLQTARALAPAATPGDLLEPAKNAAITAMFVVTLRRRFGNDFSDIVSAYNSGRPLERAPDSTRNVHVPRALRNLDLYATEAAALEKLYAIH